jgi:hypothetical protein
MGDLEILSRRLHNQRVAGTPFERPEDVVRWLGGVQSQDYPGARWSVGQRTGDCNDADVARAFDAGKILRTHLLRPTWHFVTPVDIRWMLQLTAPRVHALNAYQYRQLELDDAVFARSETLLASALQGGRQLIRLELAAILGQAGIKADKLRLSYIMMHAELVGLICSGAMRGKQQTYALLEERAPGAKILAHDEALAELARRFFVGHGPVTLKDYARWSGLAVAEARIGLEMVKGDLLHEVVDGRTYWFSAAMSPVQPMPTAAYLLPEYDECVLTYTDLGFPDLPWARDAGAWTDFFYRPIIVAGRRAGTWRRVIAKGVVRIEANLFAALDGAQWQALEDAAARYGRFVGMEATVVVFSGPSQEPK